ncbi:MAG: DUF4350 domain-containing protein [Mariniblastus sp.]|nr:DUF4350 domain-containing protein [Mariniblastus sp.]
MKYRQSVCPPSVGARQGFLDHARAVLSFLLAVSLVTLLAGCQAGTREEVETGYGRLSGAGYRTSVNGTRALANILEAMGKNVDKTTRLNPRIDRYNTIIFFSQDRSPPSQEAIDRINTWLSEDYFRTFIYIGRDFDAEIDYWQAMLQQPDESQKAHARRRLAQAMADQDQARHSSELTWNPVSKVLEPPPTDCDWFQAASHTDQNTTSLKGPLSVGVDVPESHLSYHTLLSPNPDKPGLTESLLTVDGKVFAFSLHRDEWNDGQVIVISNGSFLLNYPLINIENRVMVGNLLDLTIYSNDVLFLESGSEVTISDTEYENHNRWAWITKPPLKYIVPQFFFWGILFCFVFFPIFGRPRMSPRRSPSNFKHHISALGRLLARTKSPTQVLDWVQDYRTSSSKQRNRPENRQEKSETE